MHPDKDTPYWDQRAENDAFLQRIHWWMRCLSAGTLRSQVEKLRLRQAAETVEMVATRIRELGYQAYPTTPNAHFDLWVSDAAGQAARVEVKLSQCHDNRGRSRFQADVRQAAECDLIIWVCRNGRDWTYIIPTGALAGRRNLAIWSACPGDYGGQWARYLWAWDHLHQAVANTHQKVWQFGLPLPERRN
jgi:hypothetical protein